MRSRWPGRQVRRGRPGGREGGVFLSGHLGGCRGRAGVMVRGCFMGAFWLLGRDREARTLGAVSG